GNRLVLLEARVPVGSFIAKLPNLQMERRGVPVRPPFSVIRIVRVRDPVRRFSLVARAIAFRRGGIALLAIAAEVHAIHWLGSHPAAKINEFVRAHAVRLLATPDVVAKPGPLL